MAAEVELRELCQNTLKELPKKKSSSGGEKLPKKAKLTPKQADLDTAAIKEIFEERFGNKGLTLRTAADVKRLEFPATVYGDFDASPLDVRTPGEYRIMELTSTTKKGIMARRLTLGTFALDGDSREVPLG